jgi:hypothetical protein
MFCPRDTIISQIINKYENYLLSQNAKPNKILLINFGCCVKQEDTIEKYAPTSNYVVFVARIY